MQGIVRHPRAQFVDSLKVVPDNRRRSSNRHPSLMTEPQRTDLPLAREAPQDGEPAAQVERLLLSGLDLYFNGQYQDAINVWTRVVFLERGHGRARAYIERARSAIAEQHRQAEEWLHRGRAAYERGDLVDARQFLAQAVDHGGTSDDALALLQQINRFSSAQPPSPLAHADRLQFDAGASEARGRWPRQTTVATVVAVLSGVALLGALLIGRFGSGTVPPTRSVMSTDTLPVARSADTILERARQLYAGGHLVDALRLLDRIDIGDPLVPMADTLRGDIQRDLLATRRQAPSTTGREAGR